MAAIASRAVRRARLPFTVAALALAAALAGCGRQDGAAGPGQGRPTVVGTFTVQAETVSLASELPGRTTALQSAEIRPQVGGIVQARRFVEGGPVKAGQLLYEIDAASYRASVASAEAAVAKAEASVETNRLTAQRQAELAKIDAVSRQALQDAQATLKQAEAELAAARATLQTARIDLERTRVTSPIAGRADVSTVTVGALVTANQTTALTTVRQTDPMQVDVTQSSAELLQLKRDIAAGRVKQLPGGDAAVSLRLEDGSTYPLAGRLSVTGASVDTGTGTVTLRATFPNPQGLLLPGMYVRALLPTVAVADAMLVPQQAVSRNTDGSASVLVVGAGDKLERRTIAAERTIGSRWLVTSGLKAGERVVVEGLQKVRPGDVVQPQAVGAAASAASAPASAASR